MHIVALCEGEVTDFIREDLSFLMCVKASIVRLNSSCLEFDFTAYTRDFIHPQR